MSSRTALLCGIGLALANLAHAGEPARAQEKLSLVVSHTEFLSLEPILVTVRLQDEAFPELPAEPGDKSGLRFEIKSAGQAQTKAAVKARPGAKPLPFEAKTAAARTRIYDVLEWYQLPAEGSFSVRAVMQNNRRNISSPWIDITIRRPDKKDPEWGPVDRLHHIPWSNYVTDAFCGDTFDVTKRWPDSKLAKYCHYWNGLHYQHKKEYDKAIAYFQNVEAYPDFVLRQHAREGVIECMIIQGATERAEALRIRYRTEDLLRKIEGYEKILKELQKKQ